MRLACIAALLTAASGCGGDDGYGTGVPDVDCSQPVPTFAEVLAFPRTCNSCHTVDIADDDPRRDAPAGMNFDVLSSAQQYAEQAAVTVNEGTMPPSGALSFNDRDALFLWALCGTPP